MNMRIVAPGRPGRGRGSRARRRRGVGSHDGAGRGPIRMLDYKGHGELGARLRRRRWTRLGDASAVRWNPDGKVFGNRVRRRERSVVVGWVGMFVTSADVWWGAGPGEGAFGGAGSWRCWRLLSAARAGGCQGSPNERGRGEPAASSAVPRQRQRQRGCRSFCRPGERLPAAGISSTQGPPAAPGCREASTKILGYLVPSTAKAR